MTLEEAKKVALGWVESGCIVYRLGWVVQRRGDGTTYHQIMVYGPDHLPTGRLTVVRFSARDCIAIYHATDRYGAVEREVRRQG